MAQILSNSFVTTNVPSAPVETLIRSTSVGVSGIGVITLIGEATGGLDWSSEANLANNYFTASDTASVLKKYISGPIVDAFSACVKASSDVNIVGAPNLIRILKTNVGTLATSTVPSYGVISASNFGTQGNNYSYTISEAMTEVAPTVLGTAINTFGAALTNSYFSVRLNGGASFQINPFTGLPATYATLAEVISLLNAAFLADALPITATILSIGTNSGIQLTVNADVNANSEGFSKSLELISGGTDALALLGLTHGLYISGAESEIEVDINNATKNVNESFTVGGNIALQVGYLGTTASLTINATTISTTVTGGAGHSFSIPFAQFVTLGQLADFINQQVGYVAYILPSDTNKPISSLDKGTFGICSIVAGLLPGRIKRDLYDFVNAINLSPSVSFVASAVKGLPAVQVKTFLVGGTIGGTNNLSVAGALLALESMDTNFIVPLFSQDFTADVLAGLTDVSSTYTVDAINSLCKTHAIAMSEPKIMKNRQVFCSKLADYATDKNAAGTLSHPRATVCIQKIINPAASTATNTTFSPWYNACIAAGMQAAGFYKALTHKYANVVSAIDPIDFNSSNYGDKSDALTAGLLFLELTPTGYRWVSDQTTYGIDSNFVYNSVQAMYAADIIAVDLSRSFDNTFVGQSLADVDSATALSFLATKMDGYRSLKLIAPSDDAPVGYKNARITINGPVMTVFVEVKLATSLYFVPITVEFSPIQNTASQA
jgi:hypothetical protein